MIRCTAGDSAIRHTEPPRISASRWVNRSARRPAQSMNETPDRSSSSDGLCLRITRSIMSRNTSAMLVSTSPLAHTTALLSPGQTCSVRAIASPSPQAPAADRNQPIHLTDPRLEKAGRCRIPHLDSPARWDNEPGQPSGRGMRPAGPPVRLERRRARGGAAGGDDRFASPGAVPVRRAERP